MKNKSRFCVNEVKINQKSFNIYRYYKNFIKVLLQFVDICRNKRLKEN